MIKSPRSNKVKHLTSILSIALVFTFSASQAKAQESELRVIDEVVAVVNDGVITLSRIKREIDSLVLSMVEQGKSKEVARAEMEARQGELVANLINEELLLQKGKEIGIETDAEARVNQRLLELMKQQNLKTLDALYKLMEQQGVDPQVLRETWRRQAISELVVQREVLSKTFWGWSPKEIKAYFERNKPKFTKPERITLGEIFLSFAGRDENAVREKAKAIVARIRGGADFGLVAVENSDRPDVKDTKGDLGQISIPQLREINPDLIPPVSATRVGEITEPIETPEGIEIFKVVAREEASQEAFFDESQVREVMTYEVLADKRKAYMVTLRADAYIKISDNYRPLVAPILFAEERKTEKPSDK